jgi:hypothetical protein
VLKASQAPTTAERAAIQQRVDVLGQALGHVVVDRMAIAVVGLLDCFPAAALDDAAAARRAKGFTAALDDIPAWAVEAACRAWLRGEVDGGASRFAPTPPELRKACLQQMAPVIRQRRMLERVLQAEIEPEYSPEERAAQLGRLKRLNRIIAGEETYTPKGRSA